MAVFRSHAGNRRTRTAPLSPARPRAFYLAVEDMRRGVLPSNDQIKHWIAAMSVSPALQTSSALSSKGNSLVKDIQELFQVLNKVVDQKNHDGLIQRFLYHARLASRLATQEVAKSGKLPVVMKPRSQVYLFGARDPQLEERKRTLRKAATKDVKALYRLGQLALTSSDFRDLIQKWQKIASRVIAKRCDVADGTPMQKGHGKGLEEGYESFVEPKGGTDLQATAPSDLDLTLEELRRRVHSTETDLERLRSARLGQLPPSSRPLSPYPQSRQGSPLMKHPVDETEDQVVPEHQAILQDMKPLFKTLTTNKQFLKAIKEALKLLGRLQETATGVFRKEPDSPTLVAPELQYDANLLAAQKDLRHIIERFSSGKTLDSAIDAAQTIQREMQEEYELKDFVGDWKAYLVRCINDPAYLEHEEYQNRGLFLLSRTREFADRRYRKLFDDAFDSVRDLINGWQNDPLTSELGAVVQRIVRQDLMGGAEDGMFLFNAIHPDLIQDFRNYFIPQFLKGLHEVPVPRIESHSDGTLLVLEDLVIPSDSFMPVDFEYKTSNRFRMNPKRKLLGYSKGSKLEKKVEQASGWRSNLQIRLASINTNIRNVKFHITKAKGWPKLQDDGLADLKFGGAGLSILVNLATKQKSEKSEKQKPEKQKVTIDPRYVRVKISQMHLSMHDTSRDWLFRLISPFLAAGIKRQIERTIRDRIVDSIRVVDKAARMMTKGMASRSAVS